MEKVVRVADNYYNFLPNCQVHLGIFSNETLKCELCDYAIISDFFLRMKLCFCRSEFPYMSILVITRYVNHCRWMWNAIIDRFQGRRTLPDPTRWVGTRKTSQNELWSPLYQLTCFIMYFGIGVQWSTLSVELRDSNCK